MTSTVSIVKPGKEFQRRNSSKTKNSILLDISLNGRFLCQMRYETSETIVLDGKKLPFFDINVVKLYVESKKPSLIGKNYRIELSTQRV